MSLQYKRARALALAYGHLWARACPENLSDIPDGWKGIEALTKAKFPERWKSGCGIFTPESGSAWVCHRTGGPRPGRLSWSIAPNGETELKLHRPASPTCRADFGEESATVGHIHIGLPEDGRCLPIMRVWKQHLIHERHYVAMLGALRALDLIPDYPDYIPDFMRFSEPIAAETMLQLLRDFRPESTELVRLLEPVGEFFMSPKGDMEKYESL